MAALRWSALGDWLDAADPGALRLHHAARTALASLTAWMAIHFVLIWLAKRPMPPVGLFAVTVCFMGALVIVDAPRAERRTTLALSLVTVGLALLLASLLRNLDVLYRVVLLALIFASYVARRCGLRTGELMLLLTMGLYFAVGSGVAWRSLAWFALATAIGVASLWLWQFVLLPYDPTRSLRGSLRAFYRRAASLSAAVAVGLETPAEAISDQDLQKRLSHVRLSRRVIESQFPGVLAPSGWTQPEIGQMQVALYAAEQGLAQMVEGASQQEVLDDIPAEIRVPLLQSMRSMQEALSTGSVESFRALAAEGASLHTQVRAYVRTAVGEDRSQPDRPLAPWVGTVLRLIGGGQAVAQSAGKVRRLETHEESGRQQAGQPASAGTRSGQRPPSPTVRVFGNLEMHPTTVLGLQAVVATGLAMMVAWLLNVDHSNWVFWTAFVVIAGSTENSPLMQAESPVAQQATRMAALESEVTRLAGVAVERAPLTDEAGNTNLMRGMQARIHQDIQALIPLLSARRPNGRKAAAEQKESTQPSSVTQEQLAERLQADGARGQFRTSGEVALTRIQSIVGQLVAELGAPSGRSVV